MHAEDSQEKRTVLLIRCTEEEAIAIRNAAQRERRTVSGYVLNAVMHRVKSASQTRERIERRMKGD